MAVKKVTEKEFHKIKKWFEAGFTNREVIKGTKRNHNTISKIKKARTWEEYKGSWKKKDVQSTLELLDEIEILSARIMELSARLEKETRKKKFWLF